MHKEEEIKLWINEYVHVCRNLLAGLGMFMGRVATVTSCLQKKALSLFVTFITLPQSWTLSSISVQL